MSLEWKEDLRNPGFLAELLYTFTTPAMSEMLRIHDSSFFQSEHDERQFQRPFTTAASELLGDGHPHVRYIREILPVVLGKYLLEIVDAVLTGGGGLPDTFDEALRDRRINEAETWYSSTLTGDGYLKSEIDNNSLGSDGRLAVTRMAEFIAKS